LITRDDYASLIKGNIYMAITMQERDGIVRYYQEYIFLVIEHEDARTTVVVGIVEIC
jgi:hypothetical protein